MLSAGFARKELSTALRMLLTDLLRIFSKAIGWPTVDGLSDDIPVINTGNCGTNADHGMGLWRRVGAPPRIRRTERLTTLDILGMIGAHPGIRRRQQPASKDEACRLADRQRQTIA